MLTATPAFGSTVGVYGVDHADPPSRVFYNANPGEKNSLSVSVQLGGLIAIISDPGARSIRPGNGCLPLAPKKVLCEAVLTPSIGIPPSKTGLSGIDAQLGDRDDTFAHKAGPLRSITVDGGPGNDAIRTRASQDTLLGGPGADLLSAGNGNDSLIGGTGADDLSGGLGNDRASYSVFHDPDVPRTVSLDGVANDGAVGEGDNFRTDIEWVGIDILSSPVVLIGNDGNNRFQGGRGDDVIRGMGGSDWLESGPGNDELDGGAGADQLDGGTGDDLLLAHDGEADLSLDCDVGFDHLVADLIDPAASGCEQDDRS